MNLTEMTHVLALAQTFDQRTVGEADVLAWHSILGDVDYADARIAVTRHYDQSTERIMPAHIRRAVGQIELERARAARRWAPGQAGISPEQELPQLTSGEVAAMPEKLREWLERFAASRGVDNPREVLRPRTVEWERRHRAYLRAHDGEPNPLYRPQAGAQPVAEGRPCPVCGKPIKGPWTITRELGKDTCEHESYPNGSRA